MTTEDSQVTIAYAFRVGRSTVSQIIKQVCKQIWLTLQPYYLPEPTTELWQECAKGYKDVFNFPNCIGSIDAKHVRIKCSRGSASNLKEQHSIVLIAVFDAYQKFVVADVGSYGGFDDGLVQRSSFYKNYLKNKNIIADKALPGTNSKAPHVLLGDEGYKLQTYLLRPYPKRSAETNERMAKFNAHLNKARSVIELAFRFMTQTWKRFMKPFDCDVDTVVEIVKATCALHNFIKIKRGNEMEFGKEISRAFLDQRKNNIRATAQAVKVREVFADYFNNHM